MVGSAVRSAHKGHAISGLVTVCTDVVRMVELSYPAPVEPAARSPRTSVMLTTHVFTMGAAEPSTHRVINLSATGVCIAQPAGLQPDTIVAVSIGQIDHAAADIVWVRGGLAGLKFRRPIDLAAARTRRASGSVMAAPGAGWLGDLTDAYRG